ncbi:hypothetical protein BDR26DRAFT_209093 [Obelidium mucronatum]|nr:hypothetical protein BDR26DRAFT_209093 [Obelidium mucronatum]
MDFLTLTYLFTSVKLSVAARLDRKSTVVELHNHSSSRNTKQTSRRTQPHAIPTCRPTQTINPTAPMVYGNILSFMDVTKTTTTQDVVTLAQKTMKVSDPILRETVPEDKRISALELIHSMGHFGADSMVRQLWRTNRTRPSMKHDALEHVKSCPECQRWNIARRGFHP